ncbi:MAG: hypothetical protein IPK85_16900 [Gemmatimonadetes bacterium]|nr:hypothetical protein [Gemmatimonadota bacterium]
MSKDVILGWPEGLRRLALGAVLVTALAACNEDLVGGAACPSLCPGTQVVVRDTVLDAVTFDTVINEITTLGAETALLLAARGDTLDTRVIVRFDSLPKTVTRNGGDSVIAAVDSAYLLLRLNASDTRITDSVRIDVYDVDTTASDTSTAAVLALFRPDRLIGGSAFDTTQVKDSMRVYLTNEKLLAKISGSGRLRVGLRATSKGRVSVSVGAANDALSAALFFDPVPSDTAIKALTVSPRSMTPADNATLRDDLLDYFVIARGAPPPPSDVLSIGGLPARRSFLRFDVPTRILDSSTVLRATLELTQRPNRFLDARDSVLVLPQVVTAGEEVRDLARAVTLLSAFPVDTVRVAPGDSGVRNIEVAAALRQWTTDNNPFKQQRALVIRSNAEGLSPFDAHFFSLEAPAALRPKLRVSYSLRTSFGIP